jgi:hypothetical protein
MQTESAVGANGAKKKPGGKAAAAADAQEAKTA